MVTQMSTSKSKSKPYSSNFPKVFLSQNIYMYVCSSNALRDRDVIALLIKGVMTSVLLQCMSRDSAHISTLFLGHGLILS